MRFLAKKSTRIFQTYDCKNLNKAKSIKNLIRNFYLKKNLFLVTNGHFKRQENKIYHLGIKKYFKKIYILDGKKKKLKPSIKNVKYLVNQIAKFGNKKSVYIGDDLNIDKNFAKNLKITFIYFKFFK